MLHSDVTKTFLYIIRLGIGSETPESSKDFTMPEHVDWNDIQALAERQGLSAVFLDGINQLPQSHRPPKLLLLQWIGTTLQDYEFRYKQYQKALGEMAGFYKEHGIKMMVLKGYACSIDWPKPEHRPCGDIDIWQFGKQKDADALIESLEFRDESLESVEKVEKVEKVKKIKVDRSHHHHTVFYWNEFMVENHYDFLNVHHHKSNVALEKIFKELGQDDSYYVEVNGEKVYLPSPNLHALFLLRHTMNHFATTKMFLRQLLDWAFFVQHHRDEIDWNWLEEQLEVFGMKPLYDILNTICVEDLGFSSQLFPQVQISPLLKERVLNEILEPEMAGKTPKGFIPRILFKFRRWRANAWKHQLCYKESMRSAFWSGIKNHLLKPSSI